MTNGNLGVYEQIDLSQFVSNNWASFEGKFDGLMNVNFNFLKLDLTAMPWNMVKSFEVSWACIGIILIPIISGLLSYLLSRVTSTSNGQEMQPAMKSMLITMPLMSVWIAFVMPASLGLYWIASSAFSIVQESTLGKYFNKKIQQEEDERQAKRDADRQLRMEEAKRLAAEQRENPQKKKKLPEKKPERKQNPTNEAGRVGERPYARGRSYVENRYDNE